MWKFLMHITFSFPLLHCYSAMDVLQMQMQHCNKYQNIQDLSLPSESDILPIYWSCRVNAIYDLPINLRYIHKRVPPLIHTHACVFLYMVMYVYLCISAWPAPDSRGSTIREQWSPQSKANSLEDDCLLFCWHRKLDTVSVSLLPYFFIIDVIIIIIIIITDTKCTFPVK